MTTAATYQAIIDAIDAAILSGVSGPGELTCSGRTIRYRSLRELAEIRDRYVTLAARASGKTGYRLTGYKSAGGRL